MKPKQYSKTRLWMAMSIVVQFILVESTSGLPRVDRRQLDRVESGGDNGAARCRCAPDQWEGLMMSIEREFEARNGVRPLTSSMAVSVHYDYVNGKFAMTDLKSGRRTVAHYRQGIKYVITPNGCFKLYTDQPMPKMCLPDEAELVGDFLIGTDIPVGVWQFTNNANVSTRTTVLAKNCVPVSEEVYISDGDHSLLTTSQYVDMSLGVADETVFDAPPECTKPARRVSLASDGGLVSSGGVGGERADTEDVTELIDDVNDRQRQQSLGRSKRRSQQTQHRQLLETANKQPVSMAQTIARL